MWSSTCRRESIAKSQPTSQSPTSAVSQPTSQSSTTSSQPVAQSTMSSAMPNTSGDRTEMEVQMSENAYKPQFQTGAKLMEDEQETQTTLHKFESILDELTPETFEDLIKQALELKVDSEDRVIGITNLIFEKALSEQEFTSVYAKFCYYLQTIRKLMMPIPEEEIKEEDKGKEDKKYREVTFRGVLLTKCQREFEKEKEAENQLEQLQQQMDQGEGDGNEEEEKAVKEDLEQKAVKEDLEQKAVKEDLEQKAVKEELEQKVVKEDLEQKAVKEDLEQKAVKEDLEQKAVKEDLEQKAVKEDLEQKAVKEELEQAVKKAHHRTLRNIIFIGELFQVNMLTETIMHDCIFKLLKVCTDYSIECVVKLLEVVGKKLDHPMAKQRMDQYFAILERMVVDTRLPPGGITKAPTDGSAAPTAHDARARELSSQVKFLVVNILDMRGNGWKKPLQSQPGQEPSSATGGARPEGHGSAQGDADGWNTVPARQVEQQIEPTRMKLTKPTLLLPCGLKGPARNMVHQEVLQRLKRNEKNERIYEWIDENVSKEDRMSPQFVREFFSAICRHIIVGNGSEKSKLNTEEMKNRVPLVRRYVDTTEKETQALFGIQHLMCELEHPQDLARILFEMCYDEDMISEDSFYDWESHEGPPEDNVGKGVVKLSTRDFFNWLRSGSEDEQTG